MELHDFVPTGSCPPASDPMQYYGLLGDYVGGFWGTVIGALTLLGVFLTWRSMNKVDYKSKTFQIFVEMLRTHEEIVSSIEVNDLKGREAISLVLSEFYAIYKITRQVEKNDAIWSIEQRIDIAYTYTFYGPQLQTQKILNSYNQELIKQVGDGISRERIKNGNGKRAFKGHQNRFAHYFRNLFSAYTFIDESDINIKDKKALGKVLRSKLSNYEQALLALNAICHLGQEWERTGILREYLPIKNIPKDFFSFDEAFDLKTRFPYIVFEWESRTNDH
jgi:hypothetical protein